MSTAYIKDLLDYNGNIVYPRTKVEAIYDVDGNIFTPYKAIFFQYTILASGWSNNIYSFETNYPAATCDIEIELDSTATSEQVEAWSAARPTSVFGTNTMKALGDVPTVDIPVIIKKVVK